MGKKLTFSEFTAKALTVLPMDKLDKDKKPTGEKHAGFHVVYSGFNNAVAKHFDKWVEVEKKGFKSQKADIDWIKEQTDILVKAGEIAMTPAKGGAMIYPADHVPTASAGDSALAKMGL